MECSYCGTGMQVTRIQVKRRVPRGAKDLGLSDEETVWKCPKCEQTSPDEIRGCATCGKKGPLVQLRTSISNLKEDDGIANTLRNGEFPEVGWSHSEYVAYRCAACSRCKVCQEPVGEEPFRCFSSGDYAHERCFLGERKRYEAELQAASQAVHGGYLVLSVIFGSVIGSVVGFIISLAAGSAVIPVFAVIGACIWGWIGVRNQREVLVKNLKEHPKGYHF
jgi:hypothetical protein